MNAPISSSSSSPADLLEVLVIAFFDSSCEEERLLEDGLNSHRPGIDLESLVTRPQVAKAHSVLPLGSLRGEHDSVSELGGVSDLLEGDAARVLGEAVHPPVAPRLLAVVVLV